MQGVDPIIVVVAVEVSRGRHTGHDFLMLLHVRLVGLLRGETLLHALQRQGLGGMPGGQRPLQKILLPAGNAVVNLTGLGVQGPVKVRSRLVRRLPVGGDLHPIVGLELSNRQLLVSKGGGHRGSVDAVRRVAALAGYVVGVAVGGNRSRDGGLCSLRRRLLGDGRFPLLPASGKQLSHSEHAQRRR